MKVQVVRRCILAAAALLAAGCSSANQASPSAPAPQSRRDLPGRFEVIGRGAVNRSHTSDLWVFRGTDGRDYAYTGTWGACDSCYGNRMYAWDVTDPAKPTLTDSVMVDARVVNDVKVNDAGTVAVITREGASDRRNGIIILDTSTPAHPKVLSNYFEGLTGGVHNTFIEGNLVYAINDGTRDVHIIDISDPKNPKQVGRWGLSEMENPNKYLHDIWIKDGLAYVSYWDDGLIILDVGRGIKGGTPTSPKEVSRFTYRTRPRGAAFRGREYGNTHVAFPYTNRAGNRYVFVGDEIFPESFDVAKQEGNPGGYIHVINVNDLNRPLEVARYEVPDAGAHNVWVQNDTLYVAYYNAGLRAVDVSGTLSGDLRAEGREIATLATTDSAAFVKNRPFAWGPQPYRGNIYTSDYNSGLWITRVVPADSAARSAPGGADAGKP